MSRPSRALPVVASILVLVAACGPPGADADAPAASADSARAEIVAELERYYADFSARDWDAFSAHFWPGATITTVWRPPGEESERVVVTPVPEFVARAPEGPGSREIFEERMESVEVRVSGSLAQAWARYSARFGDPGAIAATAIALAAVPAGTRAQETRPGRGHDAPAVRAFRVPIAHGRGSSGSGTGRSGRWAGASA